MAISHVNGITAANLSAITGLSKSTIAAINGITAAFSGTVTPLTTMVAACGAECNTFGLHWASSTGLTFDSSIKRTGATSMNITRAASTFAYNAPGTFAGNVSTHSFYLYFTTLPTVDCYIFKGGSTTAIVGITYRTSGTKLYCAHGSTAGTTIGSGISITTGQWYRIDVKLDQTSGAKTIDAYVDGVVLTGDTNSTASAGAAPQFSSNGVGVTINCNIDDYVACDGSTNFPIGAHTVESFVPTADGSHVTTLADEFERTSTGTDITGATTDAYQLVDELPIGFVTDYVNLNTNAVSTDYVEVIFGPAPGVSAPAVAPCGFDVLVTWSGATATNSNRILRINDNGTTDDVVNLTSAQGTGAINAKKSYMAPPSGAAGWSLSGGNGNFNNLRMRFSSTSPVVRQRWHAAQIEAVFR